LLLLLLVEQVAMMMPFGLKLVIELKLLQIEPVE
jgi:hypothetical protein